MATQLQHNGSMLTAIELPIPALKTLAPRALAQNTYYAFLLAVAVWSVWTAGRGIYQLSGFQSGTAATSVETSADGWAELMAPDVNALATGGSWNFPGCKLGVLAVDCRESELSQLLANFSCCPMKPKFDYETAPDAGGSLLELVRGEGSKRVVTDGLAVYTLDRTHLRARVVAACPDGSLEGEHFLAGIVAQSTGNGTWRAWGMTPGMVQSDDDIPQHLMPLPNSAQRICSRNAANGDVYMEFVAMETSAQQLVAQWKQEGWDVRPWDTSSPNSFAYVCKRHNNVTLVWSRDPLDSVQRLVITRESLGSDAVASLSSN